MTFKVPCKFSPGWHYNSECVGDLDDFVLIISVSLPSLVLFPSEYSEIFGQKEY